MSSFRIWNAQNAVKCESRRVPSLKSIFFGTGILILYFPYCFHVVCPALFPVYFYVPCSVIFTVYFHTVIFMFCFFCYWLHSKANAFNKTIQLCLLLSVIQFKLATSNGWKWRAIYLEPGNVKFRKCCFFLWGLFWRRWS